MIAVELSIESLAQNIMLVQRFAMRQLLADIYRAFCSDLAMDFDCEISPTIMDPEHLRDFDEILQLLDEALAMTQGVKVTV